MEQKLKFVDITSFAFKTAIANLPSLLGCIALWALTIWIPYVNVGTTIALMSPPASLSKGKILSPLHIFDASYRKYMGEFFLASGLMGMILYPAFMFMIVPGIILSIAYGLTMLLIVDKGKSATEAMKLSLDATQGHKMAIFLWNLFFAAVLVMIPVWIFSKLWMPLAVVYFLVANVAALTAKAYIYGKLTQHIPSSDAGQVDAMEPAPVTV